MVPVHFAVVKLLAVKILDGFDFLWKNNYLVSATYIKEKGVTQKTSN